MRVSVKVIFSVCVISFIISCASVRQDTFSKPAVKAEDAVAARAAERWGYVLTGQYDKAYEYFAPNVKAVKTIEAFAAGFGRVMRHQSAEHVSVLCSDADRCIATFKIGAVIPVPGFMNQVVYRNIEEVWLLEDGQWGYFEK